MKRGGGGKDGYCAGGPHLCRLRLMSKQENGRQKAKDEANSFAIIIAFVGSYRPSSAT